MSRLLLIENPEQVSKKLLAGLIEDGHEVTTAVDGRDGLVAARETKPALIIVDVDLPRLDGFSVVGTLRRLGHSMPALFLSQRSDEADVLRGFQAGADDYVTRPFSVAVVLARANALLRRVPTVDRLPVITCGDITIDQAARTVHRGEKRIRLARREYELLVALVTRGGAVVTRQELLRTVWGYRGDALTRTVDMHIAELRRKLEDTPARPRNILTIRKIGYRIDATEKRAM